MVGRELKSFAKDLRVGQEYERRMIAYLSQFFDVRSATIDQQHTGIDMVLRRGDEQFTVELKADKRSKETGNAFIETMSQVEMGVPGWAWTCRADRIIYWVLPDEVIVVKPTDIRERLAAKEDAWMKMYPTKLICNRAWHTQGYLVPLDELRKIATFAGRIDA